ncbi:hypothetical protein KBK19_16550 [Microvirga sp. STR05]|uniref:DUF4476 domain-containing protein n=1 Tax=Hymenobacter duratus TaxID=2771356 RepID=A0ABR8JM18_9BACT|nr:hypothetical protein [Hymenobacter duratus]MBD2716656.1 hypothetical protein [Hymenobacter duratus]MBR7951571.1 hypothetical protein [Microvirga sp. STR05]
MLAHVSQAQGVRGTWYLIHRSGLVQFTIGADSLLSKRLFPDFSPKQEPPTANGYEQIVSVADRQLIISRSRKEPAAYAAVALFEVVPGRHFKMAWNAPDTTAASAAALVQLHAQDRRPLFGYYYFHHDYIDALRKMKAPETMTKPDFDAFLTQYANRLKESAETFRKYNYGYVAATYNFELLVQALFEQGYNPLQNVRTMETLFKRFYDEQGLEDALKARMKP